MAHKRSAGDADLSSVASDVSDDDCLDDDNSSIFDGSSGDATIRSGALGTIKGANGTQRPERSSDRKRRRGVIEKRRRDRINNSLCELRRLVPQAFEKQGNAKLEKAEILQLTVDYLRDLHLRQQKGMLYADPEALAVDYRTLGYRECMAEVARYLSLAEGLDTQDPMRLRLLTHLQCTSTSCQPNAAPTPPLQVSQQLSMPQHSTPRGMPNAMPQGPPLAHQPGQWVDSTTAVSMMHHHFVGGLPGSPPISAPAMTNIAPGGSYNPATPDQSPAGQQPQTATSAYAVQPGSYIHLGTTQTPGPGASTPSSYNPIGQNGFSPNPMLAYNGSQQQFAASSNYAPMPSGRNPVLQQQTSASNDANAQRSTPNWCQLISAGLAAAYDAVPLSSANDNHQQLFSASSKLANAIGVSATSENTSAGLWQQPQHHQSMIGGIKPELLF